MKVLHLCLAGVVVCVIICFILVRRSRQQKQAIASTGGLSAGSGSPTSPGKLTGSAPQVTKPRVVEWMYFGAVTGNATIVKPKTSIKIDTNLEYLKLVGQPGDTVLAVGRPGKTNIVLSAGTVRLLQDPSLKVEMHIASL
jgi:hypothetical protein